MNQESNEPLTFELLRKLAGYSQAKLGKQIGVSQSAVKLWESGKCEPSISNVIALAKVLKVSIKTICSAMGIDVAEVPND